jgi:hypothetical protein
MDSSPHHFSHEHALHSGFIYGLRESILVCEAVSSILKDAIELHKDYRVELPMSAVRIQPKSKFHPASDFLD